MVGLEVELCAGDGALYTPTAALLEEFFQLPLAGEPATPLAADAMGTPPNRDVGGDEEKPRIVKLAQAMIV